LVKTAVVSGTGKLGDVITYTFAVTNTGNTSLTNVVVTDPMVGLTITGNPIATLAVGASSSAIKGTYTITQSDIDAGKVVNTALATAKDPKGNDVTDISGTSVDNNTPTVTPLTQKAGIAITKDGVYVDSNKDGITNIGDIVTFKFVVTNTGNVTLTNVTVTDPLPGLVMSGSPITLNIGASNANAFVGTYSITQADIDKGVVYNLATVTGTPPFGDKVTATSTDPTPTSNVPAKPDCRDCTITPLTPSPKLQVVKTASETGYSLVGDIINYTIQVKNTGNVTLYQILVTDPLTGLSSTIPSLVPGASKEFAESYTVTKIDLTNNSVINTANAVGFTPSNTEVSASDKVEVEKSLVLGCGTILVHNAFSPNGDGINDVFVIDNIDNSACYPENTVEIYNRWGVLVFETKNYNNQSNNFEGISRGRTTISKSEGLPTGTYFYILNYTSVDGNGDLRTNKKDGYLYLTK
ncbi:gliding motility-associated C-terminal domain-containing protein, partial [Flavobacterium weaverense]